MSNQLSRFKKKDKLTKKEAKSAMQHTKPNMKMDFRSRVLPKSILIDVKGSVAFIGDETNPIGNCKQVPIGNSIEENESFVSYLESFKEGDINKIILDNGDGFKIFSLSELITSMRFQINRIKDPKVHKDSIFVINNESITSLFIWNDEIYGVANRSDKYDTDVLLRFDDQMNLLEYTNFGEDDYIARPYAVSDDFLIFASQTETELFLISISKEKKRVTFKIAIPDHNALLSNVTIDDGKIIAVGVFENREESHGFIFTSKPDFTDISLKEISHENNDVFVCMNDIVIYNSMYWVFGSTSDGEGDSFSTVIVMTDKDLNVLNTTKLNYDISSQIVISNVKKIGNSFIMSGVDTIGGLNDTTVPVMIKLEGDEAEVIHLSSIKGRLVDFLVTDENIIFVSETSLIASDENVQYLVITGHDLNVKKTLFLGVCDSQYADNKTPAEITSVCSFKDSVLTSFNHIDYTIISKTSQDFTVGEFVNDNTIYTFVNESLVTSKSGASLVDISSLIIR